MFLAEVFIENFRIFGAESQGKHFRIALRPGLNILAGENDSGKSAVIDAIRYVLWTTSLDYNRLSEDDFNVCGEDRATTLTITCAFAGLSKEDAARFLEWLSVVKGEARLYVTLQATRLPESVTGRGGNRRIPVTVRSGKNADGPPIEGEIREFLRVTYLRPLRDAEAELAAGRGSRLSQILGSHPRFQDQGQSDFDPDKPDKVPRTLAGIMRQAEERIRTNEVVTAAKRRLNVEYLEPFSIGGDVLKGEIGVAREADLRQILEKLDLWLEPPAGVELRTRRGLGFNNVLFMATELLLLGEASSGALPLLLIEEPEAHLHPQMQLRLMEFLESKCSPASCPVQVLLTTHSPNLASKADLECITLMYGGRPYSLAADFTKLAPSDYRFLRRFLDVTKANLFFAKSVAIVEGDAENILLPVFAELLERPFSKHGVSVVNVGGRGLFRYARIFQRKDDKDMPIRVACLADRDVPPADATYVPKRTNRWGKELPTFDSDFTPSKLKKIESKLKANDGGPVQTFVSPAWTLEHDLAICGLAEDVHVAIQLARKANRKPDGLTGADFDETEAEARAEYKDWGGTHEEIAAKVYEDLFRGRASKAEAAQFLAEVLHHRAPKPKVLRRMLPKYLTDAIDYLTGPGASGGAADASAD